MGAALVGARVVATDSLTSLGPRAPGPALAQLTRPTRPVACCRSTHLRKVVDWCRERGTLLVSDECYLECAWDGRTPVSVLHPDVCGDSHDGILAVHSLSKRSNLAGYRCGFVAGDRAVVAELLAVRKNLGLIQPGPQQVAMAAALADDAHVEEQHARYAARRAVLRPALERRGLPHRPLGGVALPLGDARRGLLGHRRPASPTSASWSRPARSTGRPARGTCGWRSPRPTNASPPLPLGSEPVERPDAHVWSTVRQTFAPGMANAPSSSRHSQLVVLVEALRDRRVGHRLRDAHGRDRLEPHDGVLRVRAQDDALAVDTGDGAAEPMALHEHLDRQMVVLGATECRPDREDR